jgi:hypothetical protein
MADIRQKAVATAATYDQGNIASLDDAMTRRLIASTVLTESHGGDLAVTSRQGNVGRYQAGAGWLADAEYMDADKLKASMSGYRSEWAWANSGGMITFLENQDNWKNGLSLEQYKQSPELQDRAFKINAEQGYERAVREGILNGGDRPGKIAGFLKAEHVMGYSAARSAANGERVMRGPDGVSNYDCMHDITRDRDGLNKYFAQVEKITNTTPTMMLSDLMHQEYSRYAPIHKMLDAIGGFSTPSGLQNAAGFVVLNSKKLDVAVDVIHENKLGDLFPTQNPGMPHEKTFKVTRAEAEAFPIAEATKHIDVLNQQSKEAPVNLHQVRSQIV